ncbi:MAG: flagellar assembly protein T N-terminal domain-containing protein [Candidatus Fermentibacteraceae bacterium]
MKRFGVIILLLFMAAGCGTKVSTAGTPPPDPGTPPGPGETEVLCEGVSAITGRLDTARDQAISDALRKAVEQGVGAYIDGETQVENFQLISDRIYSRASGFVSSYRVIHEEQSGGLYRVIVRAVVNTDGIEGDLAAIGILMTEQGRPRVMVLVRELSNRSAVSLAGLDDMGSMFETQLLEGFRRKGFPVVDASTTADIIRRDQLLLILEGDDRTAALVGLEAGAEIIVSGTVARSSESRVIAGSPREVHVFDVDCRAVNTRTAAVLAASASTTEVPFSESQARSQASEKTADHLITAILDGWTVNVNSTMLHVTNAEFQALEDLRERIRSGIRGVSGVLVRDFTGSRATLEVVSETPSTEVIESLPGIGGGFTITGITGNRVELRLED